MEFTRTTGIFTVKIQAPVDKQTPITPEQIRSLSKSLEDLAADIRKLAKGLPLYDPKKTH